MGGLGKSTFTGQPLGESTSSRGREMAFLMIGEMGGAGGERSLELPRGLSGVLRTWRSVREKNPSFFSEVEEESPSVLFPAPPWLLRNEVSPNTSPPRPTCIVWRKSPNGGLIMSGVRSPLKRRFPEEWETRPFRPANLPKFMASLVKNCKFPESEKKYPQKVFKKNGVNTVRKQTIHVSLQALKYLSIITTAVEWKVSFAQFLKRQTHSAMSHFGHRSLFISRKILRR